MLIVVKDMRKKNLVFIVSIVCLSIIQVNAQEKRGSGTPDCVTGLEIHRFRVEDVGNGTPPSIASPRRENRKVVVGRTIGYRARPGSGTVWDWDLGSGSCTSFTDYWNLQSNSSFSDRDNDAIIPNSSLPASNDDFGDTNGLVKVSNGTEESCVGRDGNTFEVEVFFEKDATTNPGGSDPNWFFYWKQSQEVQNLLTIPGIHLYDMSSCDFNSSPTSVTLDIVYDASLAYNPGGNTTYGYSLFNTFNMDKEDPFIGPNNPKNCITINDPSQLVIVGYDDSAEINIGEGCGHRKLSQACNPSSPNHEGIHTFYTTVIHEVEHALITCEVWNFTHPSDPSIKAGYNSLWDSDNDGYKDIWEQYSSEAIQYGFTVGTDDSYDGNYANCFCAGTCSVGTMFEETRCRMQESMANPNAINDSDWSFDPTNDIQGKQWN